MKLAGMCFRLFLWYIVFEALGGLQTILILTGIS